MSTANDRPKAEPIAGRTLSRILPSGDETRVQVTMWAPQTNEELDFSCAYQIVGLGDDAIHSVRGVDQIQALLLTMSTIATTLAEMTKSGARLKWEYAPEGDLGFGPTLEEQGCA